MNPSKKFTRATIIASLALALLMGAYLVFKYNQKTQATGKSLAEILEERGRVASTALTTPLGKLILEKKWESLKTDYHPKSDYPQLSEILRALFIEMKWGLFTPKDIVEIQKLGYASFADVEKNEHSRLLPLLVQLERMSGPNPDGPLYQEIKGWLKQNTTSPEQKRISVIKTVIQAENPDTENVQQFLKKLGRENLSLSDLDWIDQIDLMKNQNIKEELILQLQKTLDQRTSRLKGPILYLLSKNNRLVEPLFSQCFALLQSDSPLQVEYALRALSRAHKLGQIPENLYSKLKSAIGSISDATLSPYAKQKLRELKSQLTQ